jgi:hypothetical protein
MALPKGKPWVALIKVNSLEKNHFAFHGRHYGMKVVEWSVEKAVG